MKHTIAVSSVAALALALPPLALARTQTTAPGVVYTVKVVLTNTAISIAKDKFSRGGVTYYPRGAEIRFAIVNRGTRPYALKLWNRLTPPIMPLERGTIIVTWNQRGVFPYATEFDGHAAGPKGFIVIF